MPVFLALKIKLCHSKPVLLAVAAEEHLLGVIDHKDALVGEDVRLGQVTNPLGVDVLVSVGEVLTVVGVAKVADVLLLAEVVLVVNVGFADGGLGQVELDEGLQDVGVEVVNPVFVDRTEI